MCAVYSLATEHACCLQPWHFTCVLSTAWVLYTCAVYNLGTEHACCLQHEESPSSQKHRKNGLSLLRPGLLKVLLHWY